MFPDITPEEYSACLDAVAGQVWRRAGGEGPPINAFALARALGLVVALDDRQPGRARYVRQESGSGAILLKPEARMERRQWAIAHEIGEHVAHDVFGRLGVDPQEVGPNAREHVANDLAARLLLPTTCFGPEAVACQWDVPTLKTIFATASHELIARRMLDFSPTVIITLFDQGKLTLRRSNVDGQAPPLDELEKRCWEQVHHSGRPGAEERRPVRVQGWAIHEPGWQREILRTEWAN